MVQQAKSTISKILLKAISYRIAVTDRSGAINEPKYINELYITS